MKRVLGHLADAQGYIHLHEWFERCTKDHELLDQTPRVTQFEVRQLIKRLQVLEGYFKELLDTMSIHQTVLDTLVLNVLGDDRYAVCENQDLLPAPADGPWPSPTDDSPVGPDRGKSDRRGRHLADG